MLDKYERMVQEKKLEKSIFRVGAYCRVSTDRSDQANSFESQQKYFIEFIERNPKWELVDIFADEGKSGTSTKKREAFNRMITCAKNGDLDLIVTKEISRFARNTLDSIFYTRELKRFGVGVIFLNDNINTLEPDAELRLTIMSSIAQEESRKTSERVKWGQKRRMEQGVVFGRNMLGYDVRNGEMFINEEGAEIVKLIFHKFANEGKGTCVIARELRESGIKSYMCNSEWSNTTILRIIRNEKYCGDLVQKKTFTPDYLTHEKKYNRGEEEFVIIRNHHEAIISRELFEKANEILESRVLSQKGKPKYSIRYAFSGKIKCGICGSSFVARHKTRKDGSQNKRWQCLKATRYGKPHMDKTGGQLEIGQVLGIPVQARDDSISYLNDIGCTNDCLRNEDALHIMGIIVHSLDFDKVQLLRTLTRAIEIVLEPDNPHVQTGPLEAKFDYDKQTPIKDIEGALQDMLTGTHLDDVFYRNILDKMVIHNRDRVDIYLSRLPHQWCYAR